MSIAPRIYVASSWRNLRAVKAATTWLRSQGYEAYDFTEPDSRGDAFHWTEIDGEWQSWTPARFRELLWHPIADRGFNRDFTELRHADGLLLLLPCGRSAHLELGYAIGAGKPTAIVLQDGEPELMYRAVGALCLDLQEATAYFDAAIHINVGNATLPPVRPERDMYGRRLDYAPELCGVFVSRVSERGTNPHHFDCALPRGHFGPHKSKRQIALELKRE